MLHDASQTVATHMLSPVIDNAPKNGGGDGDANWWRIGAGN
jgi:hypothetical protein